MRDFRKDGALRLLAAEFRVRSFELPTFGSCFVVFLPRKTQTAHAWKACAVVFSLYIQNIKLEGVNWTFSETYISMRISGLEKRKAVGGLTRFWQFRRGRPRSQGSQGSAE